VTVRDAVVPIAGLGTRLLPATRAVPKALLPLVDRPVIELVVEELAAAGIERAVLVTGHGGDAVLAHLAGGGTSGLEIESMTQPEPLGLGDAVLRGGEAVTGRPFAVALGDALIDGALTRRLLDAFDSSDAVAAVGVQEVPPELVDRYGIVEADESGTVRALVEKPAPDEAPGNLAVAGRYVLAPEALEALRDTTSGRGGEVQLTDGLQRLCAGGTRVVAVRLEPGERRLDVGDAEGYATAFVERALADPRFGARLRARVAGAAG
jgi:UTP--glucose-1-phosphate uridylyltransferase